MNRKLLNLTLALSIMALMNSSANAESMLKSSFKAIGNQLNQDAQSIVKDIKTSAQKDMDNIVTSNKKAKTAEINKLKEAKLAPINAQIAAKQKKLQMLTTLICLKLNELGNL